MRKFNIDDLLIEQASYNEKVIDIYYGNLLDYSIWQSIVEYDGVFNLVITNINTGEKTIDGRYSSKDEAISRVEEIKSILNQMKTLDSKLFDKN